MSTRDRKFYWKLFLSMFQLSAFTFGGGYVIVPLMRERFVKKLGWLSEEEMLNFTAIAQSSPGAIAVNASILLGYRLAGVPGVLVSVVATVLPPLLLLSILSVGYSAFIHNQIIRNILRGMGAGVCALIISVVMDMGGRIIQKKHVLPIVLMVAAFVGVSVFQINAVLVILVGVLVGVARTMSQKSQEDGHDLP